jgi:DNA recombination-dependent growth factor C
MEGDGMGLIHGSSSFTRFVVNGNPPEDYAEAFPERILSYAFRELDENSQEERSEGWVNIMDMFDNQFLGREYFKDPYIALSWRMDVRTVPDKALRQYCRQAEEEIKRSEELEFLPKGRREEIKEAVRIRLLKRAIPRSKVYDMIWDLNSGLVIFGSVNNRLCDDFAAFFLKTFDLSLMSIFPYTLAGQALERDGMDPSLLESLAASIVVEGR